MCGPPRGVVRYVLIVVMVPPNNRSIHLISVDSFGPIITDMGEASHIKKHIMFQRSAKNLDEIFLISMKNTAL